MSLLWLTDDRRLAGSWARPQDRRQTRMGANSGPTSFPFEARRVITSHVVQLPRLRSAPDGQSPAGSDLILTLYKACLLRAGSTLS